MGKKQVKGAEAISYYPSTRSNGRYTFRLLFTRWRGSVYKLVWRNVLAWLICYYALFIAYRYAMNDTQQKLYRLVCEYCNSKHSAIPASMVLGTYVGIVAGRWWVAWDNLPWPDEYIFWVCHNVRGEDEDMRVIRRTLARYWNLASVYCMTLLSPRVRVRFPTLAHFVEAGLMTENEHQIMKRLRDITDQKLYYIPINWAAMLLTQLWKEDHITEFQWTTTMMTLVRFRAKCSNSLMKEVQSIPLVYSQVAAWGVYLYAAISLLSSQFTHIGSLKDRTLYFPFLALIELVFFYGWLKVSEAMIDPYGDDDDDLPLNLFIDGNMQESYLLADKALTRENVPAIMKDIYWDVGVPTSLPHTEESAAAEADRVEKDFEGSLFDVPNDTAEMMEQEELLAKAYGKRATMKRVISNLSGHKEPRMTTRRPRKDTKIIRTSDISAAGPGPSGQQVINMNQPPAFDNKGYLGDKIYTVPPAAHKVGRAHTFQTVKDLEDMTGHKMKRYGANLSVIKESGDSLKDKSAIAESDEVDDEDDGAAGRSSSGAQRSQEQQQAPPVPMQRSVSSDERGGDFVVDRRL